MGFFDRFRFRAENAVQVNDIDRNSVTCGWEGIFRKKGEKDYSRTFLAMVLNTLYQGISNVTFEVTKETAIGSGICSFIDRNSTLLLNQYFRKGFICVSYDNRKNSYSILQDSLIKTDGNGTVINRDCVVVYSPMYQVRRTSMFSEVKPLLEMLNSLLNTMAESNSTMGTLPVISGSSIPANPQFKDSLAKAMSKDYGFGTEQMRYFLSQAELKIDSIDLNIKDLELRENANDIFKKILNYFQIPVDLVIGGTTYDNVNAARIHFYETTVRYYAELLLKVARNLLTASNVFLPQKTITYRITNVHGLDKTLSDTCAEKNAYIDVLLKLAAAGISVNDELETVLTDLKRAYVEV